MHGAYCFAFLPAKKFVDLKVYQKNYVQIWIIWNVLFEFYENELMNENEYDWQQKHLGVPFFPHGKVA